MLSEGAWWRHLRADPTGFLLDDEDPGLIHRVLVEVLERPLDSPAVERARAGARDRGSAAEILRRQGPLGYWGSPAAYGARWSGGAWHLLAAAWLGADPHDPRVIRGAENLLRQLEPSQGGFSVARNRPPASCFTAEVCAALVRLGFGRQPRVAEAVGWLIKRAEGSSGWTCPDLRHIVAGGCPVAAVGVLKLAAEMPAAERFRVEGIVRHAVDWLSGQGFLLRPGSPKGWRRFSHPSLARTDLLDSLTALARLGVAPSEELLHGVRAVLQLQGSDGCWRPAVTSSFGEPVGQPSRWLTFKALVVLGAWGDELEEMKEGM